MLEPIFPQFSRILNLFCLLYHIMHRKIINYANFSYSNLQLPAYTAQEPAEDSKTDGETPN